jgi:hypothetical protein
MSKEWQRWMGLAAAVALAGCGLDMKPAIDDTKPEAASGKAEAWSSSDSPTGFASSLEYRVASLPAVGEATNIPWAGNYWPTAHDNINHKWDGTGSESPAAKFGRAFGVAGIEDAVSKAHGIDANSSRKACTQSSECNDKIGEMCAKRDGRSSGYCIPTWWGICHAWAPAAILAAEPKYPVTLNGVTFKVNDIKALLSLVHEGVSTKFVSLRCNKDNNATPTPGVRYDEFGRPIDSDRECRDTNPGTFHVLMTNYLGIKKQSFVYDRTFDDEVWNQPLRGYKVNQMREVPATEANRLIGVTMTGGTTVKKTGTVAKNVWSHLGSFPVAAGQAVKVRMTGSADADLHVKFGAAPTASAYDCRPYGGDSNETCDLTVPAGATSVFVSVLGYADSSTFEVNVTTGGSTPTSYRFNTNAVKFFHVKTTVYYITESSASTDGNLRDRIDTYSRPDDLEYILEVDSTGKVIGGEWVGSSKTSHPDFLWLPIAATQGTVAGGKISYARVKELADKSLLPPGGGTTGGEKVVNQSGTVAQGAWKHYGPFNVASGKNLTATMTGTNDADLYVRKGMAPTATAYDCRPYASSSNETCSVVGPGAVYVSVRGDSATAASFQLEIRYTEGTGSTTPVDPPATRHLNESGNVALGESKVYTMSVLAGTKLVIRTAAPNDVDLYIQMGAAPTTEQFLARAWTTSGNETITHNVASNGTLHIMVHGYAASSFTLTTSDN